ncbi:hypothetical protein M9H77_34645 [Catharanthus roseus]|uniref:Uncharacterized protein n=1 Tax=Catharanthus roseus TaxID=4058 RepID=A0ACB9ZQD1_CATRO|nr:hypothetical protein M9H77_34645 [Catharanthus roseus]
MNKRSYTDMNDQKICAICLSTMKQGDGRAIFTAGCSHSFHFQCITSNVRHGNQICPICGANWNEIPSFKAPISDCPHRSNPNSAVRLPTPPVRQNAPLLNPYAPAFFNDDESLDDHQPDPVGRRTSMEHNGQRTLKMNIYTEVSAVPQSNLVKDFAVLISLKALAPTSVGKLSRNQANLPQVSQTLRASVDLVTVLDVSGSMSGTKIALLKRAMGFVIQNLGSNDRLSVIAFSSTAWRLFPLHRMSETGRLQAMQAVNSLVPSGGTNIAEGLKKGTKVMEDRREKNPVAGIILLSDGQDTYTFLNSGRSNRVLQQPNYQLLLPSSIHKIPVHTFGFGIDHDASLMHSISEISGGTFSFIETENVIQDAFAQCIGGLLSVTIKELKISIECINPMVNLGALKAGSYPNHMTDDGRKGKIDVGDMYADEEKDFLVYINITVAENSRNQTPLLKVKCTYDDPFTKESLSLESDEVHIQRINNPEEQEMISTSVEVDRQKNRIMATEAMALARTAAEKEDFAEAVAILENCRKVLLETISGKCRDKLCIGLDSELKEMQERMANRGVYEALGRAYVLSGQLSHSRQRANCSGDLQSNYQTPSMAQMVNRSQQATGIGNPSSTQSPLQPMPT